MKFPALSAQTVSASVVVGISVLVWTIGVNEIILGIVNGINANYWLFYGGEKVEVTTRQGIVRGFKTSSFWSSRGGRPFYEFLGIPFARPPVGNLRFQPPVAIDKWEGVRDAINYAPKCLQFDPFIHVISGSEDCLYLNVFTPEIPTRDRQPALPVIVFIHGGLFMFGRAELFRPDYFMDEDVIIVSIHYRLGPFGFLNMGTEEVRGNMGLKDQVLAMKWVQQNIGNFGGNPNAITLMGESAGAASIHMHMLSPLSKGLFHGAVTMSGTALNHWAFNRNPQEQLEIFADRMNCNKNMTTEILSCLREVDVKKIAEVYKDVNDRLHHRLSIFAPTIEPVKDSTTFLHDTPQNLIKAKQVLNPVPWLNGVNAQEGLIYAVSMLRNKTCTQKMNEEWNQRAPALFDYENEPYERRNAISDKIRTYYMGNKSFELENIQDVVKMFSDSSFNYPLVESAKLHGGLSKDAPMYLYLYSFRSDCALAQFYMNMLGFIPVALDGIVTNALLTVKHNWLGLPQVHHGVCHGDELGMLFQFPRVICVITQNNKDYEFSRGFVKLWASFAQNGKPMTPEGSAGWPAVKPGKPLELLRIDRKSHMVSPPFESRLQFWKDLNIYS